MKIISLITTAAATIALVVLLNTKLVLPAPLGKLLSPQHGLWQNAENNNDDTYFDASLKFPSLAGKVQVILDDRLVPHVFAENENDVYFVQGYLHAKFRLWQMELQTHAAAGRASEIIGEAALQHDREFRRLGMVYAAEIAEKAMMKDTVIKAECDAYTKGVNAYIESLTESTLPIEYKLIGYYPEKWSNLKTSLFLKYMSYDLAAHEDDFEMTNAKNYFSADDFLKLYPALQDSLDPIIPKGTPFQKQTIFPKTPANIDSNYLNQKEIAFAETEKPDRDNGSNNWAVSGKKTKSGAPILCNDPHLGLNLPSLWYEMQLSTPSYNAYGATFPGAPSVIIGFNDSCAFGFTNGGRDVRDYYEITFKDESRKEYLFNGTYHPTKFRIDTIKIKDKPNFIDEVAYVQLGNDWCPVMYDKNFSENGNKKNYAVRWTAIDESNELSIFNQLNHAKNYNDYSKAVVNLHTPGQNCAFACKNGDIAIRTQGDWPAKWKGQGDYVMPGIDSSYLWQGMIPQNEVPFQYNPERGFISSANQKPVDESYPYYLGRNYPIYRGRLINKKLAAKGDFTPEDMMKMQVDNYDLVAEMVLPLVFKSVKQNDLSEIEKKYFTTLKNWNMQNDVGSTGATVFDVWWQSFQKVVYDDEFLKAPKVINHPFESTLLEGILKDTNYKFVDDVTTSQKENLTDAVTNAFKKAAVQLNTLEKTGTLVYEKYKGTSVNHLGKIPAFSKLNLPVGGGTHNINATKKNHGPSWRMVVSLTQKTEAYGIYPGGQSGNPGSKYYDNFVERWAAGEYYVLEMLTVNDIASRYKLKSLMTFNNK
jgi:penicillin G amidase